MVIEGAIPSFRFNYKAMSENQITFPSAPDTEGFFFESEDDYALEILTKKYENGNVVKKITFADGSIAIVRELLGRDQKHIQRHSNSDEEKVLLAGVTVATTINGQQQTMEYYEGMKLKQLNRITYSFKLLNF